MHTNRVFRCLTLALGFVALGRPAAAIEPESATTRAALHEKYSGVRAVSEDHAVAIYGRGMNAAPTAAKAASAWIAENAAALGHDRPELLLERSNRIGDGRRTVFAYRQIVDGLPVEYGTGRVLVLETGRLSRVIYAGGNLVARPAGGFPDLRLDADAAVEAVQALPAYGHLPQWSEPELVVIDDTGLARPAAVRAWKFYGLEPTPERFEAYTFFVDAASGRLAHVRSERYDAEISGRADGMGSPGTLPDTPSNPPFPLPLPDLAVSDEFGATALTDPNGAFLLDTAGTELTATLTGPWVAVWNQQGPDLVAARPIDPVEPNDLLFNVAPEEFATAQVNAFLHVVATHNFYKQRQPHFVAIDQPIDALVNIDATCNAFFTPVGPAVNFFRSGGCVNTAYSSVVAHEYGHFIIDRLRLRQGAFGEGFADAVAMLLYNDGVVGRGFLGPGTIIRNPAQAALQYPCFGGIHDCGQVLGGVWWNLKLGLERSLGESAGLELARQLFTDWSQITVGIRFGRNSATPLTAVEVLVADDDDGDIHNGTPHDDEICEAFALHGIACPNDCDALRDLRLRCRSQARSATLTATVVAPDASGSQFRLTLNGADEQSVEVGRLGRGSARWSGVESGVHEVCVRGCDRCALVDCGP